MSLFSQEDTEKKNTYWNTKASREHKIDTSLLFDSDQEAQSDDDGVMVVMMMMGARH